MHSLGTAAALNAALASPGRFAGLILMAPASTTGLDILPDDGFEAVAPDARAAAGPGPGRVPPRAP